MDPVELCSTLTSAAAADKKRSIINHTDKFGLTPLHLAARRGAGVCAVYLIQVLCLSALMVTRLSALTVTDMICPAVIQLILFHESL